MLQALAELSIAQANQKRNQEVVDALIKASSQSLLLRPVLMATGAMALGTNTTVAYEGRDDSSS